MTSRYLATVHRVTTKIPILFNRWVRPQFYHFVCPRDSLARESWRTAGFPLTLRYTWSGRLSDREPEIVAQINLSDL